MKKNVMIGVIIIIIVLFSILVPKLVKKNNNNNETMNRISDILYNNETNMYYITDEKGKVIHETENESDLYIYTIDPDYDPKNPDAIDFKDNIIE